MAERKQLTVEEIRAARRKKPKVFARDLADALGIAEAELVVAETGHGTTRISADPARLMPLLPGLGEVMALTRNDSAVMEKTGHFGAYDAASGVMAGTGIDLRIFPDHWVHGFAVEEQRGPRRRRSLQVFDAAGEAVHKVHLPEEAPAAAWEALVSALRLADQSPHLALDARLPAVPAPAKEGAVRPLSPDCLGALLDRLAETRLPFALHVGNPGCLERHAGPIETVKPTGAWLNILDPDFNLHLRGDHVAEVWAVTGPSGDAVLAVDAAGAQILRFSGVPEATPAWAGLVAELPRMANATG